VAWIESHQSLGTHPKLFLLCEHLKITDAQAVGHLQYFWWWTIDYAPNGDLSRFNPLQIERAAHWSGEAVVFVQALITVGFLDQHGEALAVHDWLDFCGELVKQRCRRLKEKRRNMRHDGAVARRHSSHITRYVDGRCSLVREPPGMGHGVRRPGGRHHGWRHDNRPPSNALGSSNRGSAFNYPAYQLPHLLEATIRLACRLVHVKVAPNLNHDPNHSRVQPPESLGDVGAVKRTILVGCHSLLLANMSDGLCQFARSMDRIRPDTEFRSVPALVKFVRQWFRWEGVRIENQTTTVPVKYLANLIGHGRSVGVKKLIQKGIIILISQAASI